MTLIRKTLYAVLLFYAGSSFAFDGEVIQFVHSSDPANKVAFSFNGKQFKPPLDILKTKGVVRNAEYRRFQEFFKFLYERNKEGSAESVLEVWHPQDHAEISSGMDADALEKNKAQFNFVTGMRLNMILQYGKYYICLVEMTMQGQEPFVMKYPVADYKGRLYLTNAMNGDYFYEIISHYLDETNFKPLLKP